MFFKSKGFRSFLVISLGSFVGVFCAMSLFCALHKPSVPPMPHFYGHHYGISKHYNHGFHKHHKKQFEKYHKEFKKDFKKALDKSGKIED